MRFSEGKQTRKLYKKTDALLVCPLRMKVGWTGDGTCAVSMRTDTETECSQNNRLIPCFLFQLGVLIGIDDKSDD